MEYIELIISSYQNLAEDFVGITFSLTGFVGKLADFSFVVLLMLIIFLTGSIINKRYFNKIYDPRLQHFISICLGFIVVGTLIFLLGFSGLITKTNLLILFFVLFLLGIYRTNSKIFKLNLRSLITFDVYKYFGYFLLLICFLRLIPPQASGDPLDYHLRFPRIYVQEKTMMIPALGDESYITIPQLPEMLYIPSEMFTGGESSRLINFSFFIIIYLLLYNANFYNLRFKNAGKLTALLFASSPLVIENSTAAFSDMPALLCFTVSTFLIIEEKKGLKKIFLSGLIFGGAMASKIWIIQLLPLMLIILVINTKSKARERLKVPMIFFIASFLVVALWYLRGYLIAGNPFNVNDDQGQVMGEITITEHILESFSPTFFPTKFTPSLDFGFIYVLGFISFLLSFKSFRKYINSMSFRFFIQLMIGALILPISLYAGRYAFPYIIGILSISAIGITKIMSNRLGSLLIASLFGFISLYYLLNSMLVLPYGLGWADKEEYLKRNLSSDIRAYYDFNGRFTENYRPNEKILTYGMTEFYYAPFRYRNVYYFYDENLRKLNLPEDIDKILIRGGDFDWFCRSVIIMNCSDFNIELITHDKPTELYLYTIKRRI